VDAAVTALRNGDNALAVKLATPLAKRGNVEAEFLLGVIAANGGVDQEVVALKHFKKAASKGHVKAMSALGRFKLSGKGGEKDLAGGAKLLREAIQKGHNDSTFHLVFALRLHPELRENATEVERLSIALLTENKDKQSTEYIAGAFFLGDAWKQSTNEEQRKLSDRSFLIVLQSANDSELVKLLKEDILRMSEKNLTQVGKGDGSREDKTCQELGLKVWDANYPACKGEVSMALARHDREMEIYRLRAEQHRLAVQAYEERKREIEEERRERRNMAMLQYGLNLMSGTSPYASQNFERASREYLGLPPAPEPPKVDSLFITGPNGRLSCVINSGIVNCR
jgi:hypothetical protein